MRTLINSLRYAFKGLSYAARNEQNFRIQLFVSALLIAAILFFGVSALEAVALLLMALIILILEILNTVVEKFIDLLQPRLHHYSKIIKDMMAAAVLLAAVGSVIVGALIFYPYIATLVRDFMV
jgi:undecaprenol kinase/diacylglycerol kinase (ATP)